MFEKLTSNLNKIFEKLTSVGYLTESNVEEALREIRIALLEADVALGVVKEFTKLVKEKAVGEKIVKSISPGQMVIKIVQDCLVEILSVGDSNLNLKTSGTAVVLMAGLQGSGKTTTTAKLALKLKKEGKRILLASVDVNRPAAQDQLAVLAKQLDIDFFQISSKKADAIQLTKQILKTAEKYDVLLLDTAGRLHIDKNLMDEIKKIQKLSSPIETLLVVDSLTGQDAVNIATAFKEAICITGVILTRMDSDTRGGAALSVSYITKCPIKFLGVGENIGDLEQFYPDRIASRILDMGDVVSLVEKATEAMDLKESEAMVKNFQEGQFDLNSLADQLKSLKKMGGLSSIVKFIPGVGKMMKQIKEQNISEDFVDKQLAIISSMTKEERDNPNVFNASRKKRVASGSGVSIQDVNKLLKQFHHASKAFKRLKGLDPKALERLNAGNLFQ